MQSDLLHTLIHQLNVNILALDKATEDIGIWISNMETTTTPPQIFRHLEVIEQNSEFITHLIADHDCESWHHKGGNSDKQRKY